MRTTAPTPRQTRSNSLRCAVLIGVFGLSIAGGCASQQNASDPIEPSPRMSMEAEADQALADSVAAIRRGELATAQTKAKVAWNLAQTPRQNRQAESILLLLEGTHAMLDGRADLAGVAWGTIPDPGLRSDVMSHADRLGIDVPVASASLDHSSKDFQ